MAELVIDHPRTPEDWQAVRDICCETGASGKPIEPRSRRPFFAELWIGPYQKQLPEWTFVARAEGRVVGYLTGCPDSRGFAVRRLLFHRLPLLVSVLFGEWGFTEDVRRFLHPAELFQRNMAVRFGQKLYRRLLARHPAHLHINVREGHRGGTGRRIMEVYVEALAGRGVKGLHLFCGAGPVEFYRRVGFHRLACRDFGKGPVSVMVRRIQKRPSSTS